MNLFSNEKAEEPAYRVKSKMKTEVKEIEAAARKLREIFQQAAQENQEIVFLCIGSDRYVGDSLGPLVGTMLSENEIPFRIYGTLEEPVHAFNLKGILKEIQKPFKKPLIISIDACLGTQDQVGSFLFNKGPLAPGKALEKMLPEVGDYHFKAIVNYIDPLPASQFLNDTRLFTVMNLAKIIVSIISIAAQKETEPRI
ncbi:spore protease YyaC [Metabacillus idriensis]|uniref:spore protease YyaC n=1 Tax=Metabacillus idriensis TaxID=324768 RepID=UPI003D2D28EB